MARITNAMGALFCLLIGIGYTGFLVTVLFDWVTNAFAGEVLILFQSSLIAISIVLTLILPMMIATQDKTE